MMNKPAMKEKDGIHLFMIVYTIKLVLEYKTLVLSCSLILIFCVCLFWIRFKNFISWRQIFKWNSFCL